MLGAKILGALPSTSDPIASDVDDQGAATYTARSYSRAAELFRKTAADTENTDMKE
jgi:hypothetical protein